MARTYDTVASGERYFIWCKVKPNVIIKHIGKEAIEALKVTTKQKTNIGALEAFHLADVATQKELAMYVKLASGVNVRDDLDIFSPIAMIKGQEVSKPGVLMRLRCKTVEA